MVGSELLRGRPVGGGALAVQQTGGGEELCAHADGRDAACLAGEFLHPVDDGGVGEGVHPPLAVDLDRAGHHQGVDPAPGHLAERGVGQDAHPGPGETGSMVSAARTTR